MPNTYHERLYVTWWIWPTSLAISLMLAAQFHLGIPGILSWLPYTIGAVVAIGACTKASTSQIIVRNSTLSIGGRNIATTNITHGVVLSGSHRSTALGRDLPSNSWTVYRPWCRYLVRFTIKDTTDQPMCWLVSTRKPSELLASLDLPAAHA